MSRYFSQFIIRLLSFAFCLKELRSEAHRAKHQRRAQRSVWGGSAAAQRGRLTQGWTKLSCWHPTMNIQKVTVLML